MAIHLLLLFKWLIHCGFTRSSRDSQAGACAQRGVGHHGGRSCSTGQTQVSGLQPSSSSHTGIRSFCSYHYILYTTCGFLLFHTVQIKTSTSLLTSSSLSAVQHRTFNIKSSAQLPPPYSDVGAQGTKQEPCVFVYICLHGKLTTLISCRISC